MALAEVEWTLWTSAVVTAGAGNGQPRAATLVNLASARTALGPISVSMS